MDSSFGVDINTFNADQQKFIKDVIFFNDNKDWVMYCGTEKLKDQMVSFVQKDRIDDVKVASYVTGITLVNKSLLGGSRYDRMY